MSRRHRHPDGGADRAPISDLIERDRKTYLKVQGKGDKDRLVPVPTLERRLRRYSKRGRPPEVIGDRLFISLKRRAGGATSR